MVLDEGRDEIIAVVVAELHAEGEVDAGGAASVGEQLRAKLALEEIIGAALVDEDLRYPRAVLDQGDRVVGAPGRAIGAEIEGERLLAPRHAAGRDDRRES